MDHYQFINSQILKEIRQIIEVYDGIDFTKEKVALASVVNVEESSYRRIGARMLVRSNGQWIGGISGGCLEGDALKRSQYAIYENSPSKVVYDTMEDDQNQIGVGLGCNGRIEVIFTPIDHLNSNNEIEVLRSIVSQDTSSVIIKAIEVDDQDLLGKLQLANPQVNSDEFGFSKKIINEEVAQVLQSGRSSIQSWTDAKGNTLRLLFELIRPEIHLIIVGDNYDVTALVGLSSELGWDISVVGDVKKLSKQVVKQVQRVVPLMQADSIKVHNCTAVVLLSHDYNKDKSVLPLFLEKKVPYLGMLGPKKRMLKMQEDLGTYNLAKIPIFFSPVGLEIGAESPSEIALSIAAEIVAVFRGKKGTPLRDKVGSIHPRTMH